jgi:hypothetical protein
MRLATLRIWLIMRISHLPLAAGSVDVVAAAPMLTLHRLFVVRSVVSIRFAESHAGIMDELNPQNPSYSTSSTVSGNGVCIWDLLMQRFGAGLVCDTFIGTFVGNKHTLS